ncbi:hypothetical protein Fcan01_11892 [Folsomia candida]|uniref:Uncharacterized protein n=1 Tax=Folsomia candida TaxID=158441 RepID=A0A226E839_FOLCA|nr:hypothetical protein Fcan01_11892 [Folsomia candida]
MSPWEKFFAILGATVLVGAVGYCSWKLLGGNWNAIKDAGKCIGTELKEKGLQMIKDFDGNALVQKMAGIFEKRDLAGKIDPKDVSKVWEVFSAMGYGGIIAAVMAHVKTNAK